MHLFTVGSVHVLSCTDHIILLFMSAVMTSLQQSTITGKVSASQSGFQPIISKILTDIGNINTMSPADLNVSTSSSSSAASEVKMELNSSLASNFGASSGINTTLTSNLIPSGATTGMSSGMITSGVNTGMNTIMTSGMNSGGTISGVSSTSGPQSRLTNVNPGMSSSMNFSGMNPSAYSGMNPGLNTSVNMGIGPGMNSGMGPGGMNSGLGMGPMGIGSTNQIPPPLPSGSLPGMQHQAQDPYPAPGGVGGAPGPSMMTQNPQAQQTQVK